MRNHACVLLIYDLTPSEQIHLYAQQVVQAVAVVAVSVVVLVLIP
tara:strand:+ start:833 stop:967 length:135 start_codon:yes stop_codon:yes gene_type:complete